MKYQVRLNDKGCRIGQYHLKAILTDHEVELVRSLNEEGMGYGTLAEKFGVSKSSIAKICQFARRNQYATQVRFLHE